MHHWKKFFTFDWNGEYRNIWINGRWRGFLYWAVQGAYKAGKSWKEKCVWKQMTNLNSKPRRMQETLQALFMVSKAIFNCWEQPSICLLLELTLRPPQWSGLCCIWLWTKICRESWGKKSLLQEQMPGHRNCKIGPNALKSFPFWKRLWDIILWWYSMLHILPLRIQQYQATSYQKELRLLSRTNNAPAIVVILFCLFFFFHIDHSLSSWCPFWPKRFSQSCTIFGR